MIRMTFPPNITRLDSQQQKKMGKNIPKVTFLQTWWQPQPISFASGLTNNMNILFFFGGVGQEEVVKAIFKDIAEDFI